jgi:peptidoglycan/LPS O-acetylase OafA/YrhL
LALQADAGGGTVYPPAGEAARLSGVQALRGVAACAVVLCHAARHVNKVFGAPALVGVLQAGHAGVDLFFVISGFIIVFVHQADIGRRERLGHYLGRRFNRVMPLYWIALAATLVMSAAGTHALPSMGRVVWSVLLLPSTAEPLLGIAWTLQYEVVFYAAFAVLIVNRLCGAAVFLAWFLVIVVTSIGHGVPGLAPPVCGPYGLEFFMGMMAAHLVTRHRVASGRRVAALGVFLFGAAVVLESTGLLDGFGALARCVYGPAALLLVAGVAAAERHGRLAVSGWLRGAGEASYSIYLFQFVFIGVVWQAWLKAGFARPDTKAACFFVLALASVAGGVAVSRLIEHPLLRWSRGVFALRAAA